MSERDISARAKVLLDLLENFHVVMKPMLWTTREKVERLLWLHIRYAAEQARKDGAR